MSVKKGETASFVIRFTQKIFDNDEGKPDIQWRGNIRHVQGGEEKNFTQFDDVVAFVQQKLASLTITAMENKSPEEQQSILSKSFELWKKMATTGPKVFMETIKDPKKQIANIQQQINEVGESIGHKFETDVIQRFTPGDNEKVLEEIQSLSGQVEALSKKVDKLAKKMK